MLTVLSLLLIATLWISDGNVHECHFISDTWKLPPANISNEMLAAWTEQDLQLHKFLSTSIPEALAHTGATSFDTHLKGVQAVLRHWGADNDVCNGGLFHSIYGTEGFQGFKLPLDKRAAVRRLIGERAERLAWVFCMVDRKSVDDTLDLPRGHDSYSFVARPELGRFSIPLSGEAEWLDFLELSLADWLEQVEGAAEKENPLFEWEKGEAWSYRRVAFSKMAEILSVRKGKTVAVDMYRAIYATEPVATRHLHQIITPPMSIAAKEARAALMSASE